MTLPQVFLPKYPCLLFFGVQIALFLGVEIGFCQTKTIVNFQAKDEITRVEIPARFEVITHKNKKTFAGESILGGVFSIQLESSDTLTVSTYATGYHAIEEVILINCDTCNTHGYQHTALLEQDSIFRNLKKNSEVVLKQVYFEQSDYLLRPTSHAELDKLVRTLRANPTMVLEIGGHTDNVGRKSLNQALSENRVSVVIAYLTRRGIASERLVGKGYGDTQPAAPNDTEANKRLNRRVVMKVLKE